MPIDQSTQSDILLASYALNTGSQSAAIRLAYQVAPALGLNLPGSGSLFAPSGKSITLALTQAIAPAPVVMTANAPFGPGAPPAVQQQGPATTGIVTVTLNTSPQSGDGYGQTVHYSQRARQTVHQTSGGFIVDEFGMAPGSLTIELIVAAQDGVISKLALMSSLLQKAKLANPLQPGVAASTFTYTNSIDGTKLMLTQTSIDITQNAGEPGMAHVVISGDVLRDFNGAPTSAPGLSTGAATTAQSALLEFSNNSVTTAQGGLAGFSGGG
jgi:hypothetical protein